MQLNTKNRWFAYTAFIAALYFMSGKIGLLLAIPPGNITLLWSPSGIVLILFAVLMIGLEYSQQSFNGRLIRIGGK